MERPFGLVVRALCLAAGVACLWPAALTINLIGAAAVLILLVTNIRFGSPALNTAKT